MVIVKRESGVNPELYPQL